MRGIDLIFLAFSFVAPDLPAGEMPVRYALDIWAENEQCHVAIEGEDVSTDRLAERLRQLPARTADIDLKARSDTPYRCVGGAIYEAQAAGFARIGFVSTPEDKATAEHPEASPYDPQADAKSQVDAAIARAKASGKTALFVMGANWCHDSRALAGWFGTPRFAAMLGDRYELLYIDVGTPQIGEGRNLDIVRKFGIKKLKSTPLVLLVSAEGKRLNSKADAIGWRNAASRGEDEIYRAFADFAISRDAKGGEGEGKGPANGRPSVALRP